MLPVLPAQLVTVLVAKALAFECFGKNGYCDLQILNQVDPLLMDLIVNAVFSGVMGMLYTRRALRMLESLFQAGISPNVQVNVPSRDGVMFNFGLWNRLVKRLVLRVFGNEVINYHNLRKYEEGFEYQLIELGLRHGATVDFSLDFGRCYEILGDDQLIVQVNICGTDGKMIPDISRTIYVDYRLDIVQYARKRNGVLTARDIIAYCFPHDYDHLHKLLDRNESGICPPATSSAAPCTSLPTMLLLFPHESRYIDCGPTATFMDMNGINPKECKPCLTHTDECFRYFEEGHHDRDTGCLDRGASRYFENARFFQENSESPLYYKAGY
ncbi:hypothetical protein F5Y02DRAFT_420239 [Annulohypoxylon stygium]|nr:hypothetical protein F5Y02DRAFT_420239 [Annulohypoxylon stygium]